MRRGYNSHTTPSCRTASALHRHRHQPLHNTQPPRSSPNLPAARPQHSIDKDVSRCAAHTPAIITIPSCRAATTAPTPTPTAPHRTTTYLRFPFFPVAGVRFTGTMSAARPTPSLRSTTGCDEGGSASPSTSSSVSSTRNWRRPGTTPLCDAPRRARGTSSSRTSSRVLAGRLSQSDDRPLPFRDRASGGAGRSSSSSSDLCVGEAGARRSWDCG